MRGCEPKGLIPGFCFPRVFYPSNGKANAIIYSLPEEVLLVLVWDSYDDRCYKFFPLLPSRCSEEEACASTSICELAFSREEPLYVKLVEAL